MRAISGLLLFGPSGTGKTACAQAIASHLDGAFYQFSVADLPCSNSNKQAKRIDALFAVAGAGPKPAVIFIDECDTVLSARATSRAGALGTAWNRFEAGLLVIGATNDPTKIAPKLLTGRFERKILVDNPTAAARRALIMTELAQEDHEALLSAEGMLHIVEQTAGRSAVNMERLVSTAVLRAQGLPVSRIDFELAIEEEPNDFDIRVATQNFKYDQKYGWRK